MKVCLMGRRAFLPSVDASLAATSAPPFGSDSTIPSACADETSDRSILPGPNLA